MKWMILKTGAKRATGVRPSRTRALLAASGTAVMLGVVAYKILRSAD